MPDVADPLPLLESLGATSDEVADSLRAAGVKGRSERYMGSPLAVFMQAHGFAQAFLSRWNMEWGDCQRLLLTEACSEFVRRLDAGAYPDLEG